MEKIKQCERNDENSRTRPPGIPKLNFRFFFRGKLVRYCDSNSGFTSPGKKLRGKLVETSIRRLFDI